MAPTVKETFKLASHAFIRRDNTQSLVLLDELFAHLPAPPSLAWAVELPPKSRAQERWRNQAAALLLTVSTVDYKTRRAAPTAASAPGGETEDELIDRLSARLQALYRLSPAHPHEPVIPPNLVSTLAMSARSLGVSSHTTRRMVEAYLASGLPAELIDAEPIGLASSADGQECPWWIKEASEGYEALMEMYLVDVLAGGDDAGEGDREEAKRLLDWDTVIRPDAKHVSPVGSVSRYRTGVLYSSVLWTCLLDSGSGLAWTRPAHPRLRPIRPLCRQQSKPPCPAYPSAHRGLPRPARKLVPSGQKV